jgi:hypothetical protein
MSVDYIQMEFIYVFVVDGAEWEDIIVFTSKEEAIEKSKKHPRVRLEIFSKSAKGGYHPTYNYYLNGEYIAMS